MSRSTTNDPKAPLTNDPEAPLNGPKAHGDHVPLNSQWKIEMFNFLYFYTTRSLHIFYRNVTKGNKEKKCNKKEKRRKHTYLTWTSPSEAKSRARCGHSISGPRLFRHGPLSLTSSLADGIWGFFFSQLWFWASSSELVAPKKKK